MTDRIFSSGRDTGERRGWLVGMRQLENREGEKATRKTGWWARRELGRDAINHSRQRIRVALRVFSHPAIILSLRLTVYVEARVSEILTVNPPRAAVNSANPIRRRRPNTDGPLSLDGQFCPPTLFWGFFLLVSFFKPLIDKQEFLLLEVRITSQRKFEDRSAGDLVVDSRSDKISKTAKAPKSDWKKKMSKFFH